MTEPTLEFIGRKLKDIRDDQRLQGMRSDILEQRFSTTDARLAGIEERISVFEAGLDRIESKLDRILDRLER